MSTKPAKNVIFVPVKKPLSILILLLLPMLAFAFSSIEVREDLFHSDAELAKFQTTPLRDKEVSSFEEMEIYYLAGGPGSEIWENFGHAAFLVKHPNGFNISFDYGIFTFDESFYGNFILGKLYYEAWETYAEYRIQSLKEDDRTVELVKLELEPQQKKNLWEFLLYNTEDENRTYLYDYFVDNCATRLRDIYSWSTGDEFKTWLKDRPSKETIRQTVSRYLFRSTFVPAWVLNYLLGPSVDEEITMWEACFLPDTLERELLEFQGTEKEVVYETQKRRSVPDSWSLPLRSVLMGAVLALLVWGTNSRKRWLHRTADCILGIFYTVMTLVSSVLFFMMFFTIHYVTHGNINVLVFSPLLGVMAYLHFSSMGKVRKSQKMGRWSALFLLVTLVVGILLLLVPGMVQDSTSVLIPAMMLYLAEVLFSRKQKA